MHERVAGFGRPRDRGDEIGTVVAVHFDEACPGTLDGESGDHRSHPGGQQVQYVVTRSDAAAPKARGDTRDVRSQRPVGDPFRRRTDGWGVGGDARPLPDALIEKS